MPARIASSINASIPSLHRGRVAGLQEDGTVLVASDHLAEPIPCDRLRTGQGRPGLEPGDEVVFGVTEDQPCRGFVLGALETPSPTSDSGARVDHGVQKPAAHIGLGRLERVDSRGVWVRLRDRSEASLASRIPAWSNDQLTRLIESGQDLLLLVDAVAQGSVEIVGFPSVVDPNLSGIEASHLFVDVKDEIVLRTKRGMIAIRANGDVEIIGTRIFTRARELNKILAPMIELN